VIHSSNERSVRADKDELLPVKVTWLVQNKKTTTAVSWEPVEASCRLVAPRGLQNEIVHGYASGPTLLAFKTRF
jgi:hypothetical protein